VVGLLEVTGTVVGWISPSTSILLVREYPL